MGNFDGSMIDTGFYCEGYIDNYNCDASEFSNEGGSQVMANRKWGHNKENNMIKYEFAIIPSHGFLASPDLLIRNCEIKLSFDRAVPELAILEAGSVTTAVSKTLNIENCYAMVEYVSSPDYRTLYDGIDQLPFIYEYDDVDITIKNIPENQLDVRFDNLRGGQVPDYMFIGIIPKKNLTGDKLKSCTGFKHQNVSEMNISFNGNSVNGYVIAIKNSGSYGSDQFTDWELRYTDSKGVIDWNNSIWTQSIKSKESLFGNNAAQADLDGDGAFGLSADALTSVSSDNAGDLLKKDDVHS